MRKIFLLLIVANLFALPVRAADTAVARVNGAVITRRDMEEAVAQLIPQATYHGNVSGEKRDELRQQALDALINQELLYQDAVKKGMKPGNKLVDERMDAIRARFKSKNDYKKALKAAGMTEDQLRERAAKAVLVEESLRKNVTEPTRVSDDALKEYYDKNIAKFRQPESAHLRLISLSDEAKAKEALARIKAGEDFGDVAARMSEDDYRIKGGDIGYIHKGRLLPELEDTAFKMKAGETSGLINAGSMWFIIKVEELKPAQQMTFDEVKSSLKQDLERNRASELKEKWLADLHAKAKIEVLWKPASSSAGGSAQ